MSTNPSHSHVFVHVHSYELSIIRSYHKQVFKLFIKVAPLEKNEQQQKKNQMAYVRYSTV